MIRFLINIYIIVIIIDSVLSYFPHYRNHSWAQMIKRAADVTLNPIRRALPSDLPLDISPLVVIILLQIIVALW